MHVNYLLSHEEGKKVDEKFAAAIRRDVLQLAKAALLRVVPNVPSVVNSTGAPIKVSPHPKSLTLLCSFFFVVIPRTMCVCGCYFLFFFLFVALARHCQDAIKLLSSTSGDSFKIDVVEAMKRLWSNAELQTVYWSMTWTHPAEPNIGIQSELA